MSKGNTFEDDILKLLLNGTAIANIADNAASLPLTVLYLSLHTADPGEAGSQTTNEIAYTGYARQSVARTTGGWTVSAGVASLAVNVDFPEMTGGAGGTVTHWAVGTASSGAGKILYKGAVSPTQVIATGVIPRIKGTPSGTPSTISED
jgi:hypothetical protein